MNRKKNDSKTSICISIKNSLNQNLEDFLNCLHYDCTKSALIEKLIEEFLEEGNYETEK